MPALRCTTTGAPPGIVSSLADYCSRVVGWAARKVNPSRPHHFGMSRNYESYGSCVETPFKCLQTDRQKTFPTGNGMVLYRLACAPNFLHMILSLSSQRARQNDSSAERKNLDSVGKIDTKLSPLTPCTLCTSSTPNSCGYRMVGGIRNDTKMQETDEGQIMHSQVCVCVQCNVVLVHRKTNHVLTCTLFSAV